MFSNQNYTIVVEKFAERHYVKDFEKKHKANWYLTLNRVIFVQCARIDNVLQSQKADRICGHDGNEIIKLDFAVVGTHISARSSGCRIILMVNHNIKSVKILLVYDKHHTKVGKESVWWESIVRAEYDEVEALYKCLR